MIWLCFLSVLCSLCPRRLLVPLSYVYLYMIYILGHILPSLSFAATGAHRSAYMSTHSHILITLRYTVPPSRPLIHHCHYTDTFTASSSSTIARHTTTTVLHLLLVLSSLVFAVPSAVLGIILLYIYRVSGLLASNYLMCLFTSLNGCCNLVLFF